MKALTTQGILYFYDRQTTVFPTTSFKCLFLDPYSFPVVKFCHYLIFVPVVGALFLWKHWLCCTQSSPGGCWVMLADYFWSFWKYWKHFPVVAFSLLNWSMLWCFSGWCQMGNFSGRMRGKGSKSRAVGMVWPTFMLSGLCRVDCVSILLFLNVKDVDLKCGLFLGIILRCGHATLLCWVP